MKKVVLTFGLIAGTVVTASMLIGMSFMHGEQMDFDSGELVGYTSMIVAFSTIFFGIRSYRDNYSDGIISFGKAFKIGLYITLVASAMYVRRLDGLLLYFCWF